MEGAETGGGDPGPWGPAPGHPPPRTWAPDPAPGQDPPSAGTWAPGQAPPDPTGAWAPGPAPGQAPPDPTGGTWARGPAPGQAPADAPPGGWAVPPGPAPSPYDPEGTTPAPRRGIGPLAWILAVLTVVASIGASIAVWGGRAPVDRDRWDEVVVPLNRDRDVAERIADDVVDALDLDQPEVTDEDPDVVDDFRDDLADLIRSDDREWRRLVRRAHRDFQAVVNDRRSGVDIDLTDLVDDLVDDEPRYARAVAIASEEGTGFESVEVTIVPAEDGADVRRAISSVRTVGWILLGATALLAALTVAVARRRWRAGAVLGLGVTVAQVVGVGLIVAMRGSVARSFVEDPPLRPVAETVAGSITRSYVGQAVVIALVAATLGGACLLVEVARTRRPT